MPRTSKLTRAIDALLRSAKIDAAAVAIEPLGIGSAGLNIRGNKDEDGPHHRVVLDDDSSVIYRAYDENAMTMDYLHKETEVFSSLGEAGLPTPTILARSTDPPALLLADSGGEPLEVVFREIQEEHRPALWANVAKQLRQLHDVDPEAVPVLRERRYVRPWTDFVPYFFKSLKPIRTTRPDLVAALDQLASMRKALQRWHESRPRTVTYNAGFNLPGMLIRDVAVESWLSLGYYVWMSDPARDIVGIALHHKEWTGDELPEAFYDAYGSHPDELTTLVYEMKLMLGRGAAYHRGTRRASTAPPTHSTALRALDELPQTVERVRDLLSAP